MSKGNIVVSKKRGYTIVPNGVLPEGKRVSARAWGIYVYLLSRPDGWKTHAKQLANVFTEGVGAIYTALQNLVDAGLMKKVEYYEGGLKRQRYEQISPEDVLNPPDTDFRDLGNRDLENRRVPIKDLTNTVCNQSFHEGFTFDSGESKHHVSPLTPKVSEPNRTHDPVSPKFGASGDRRSLITLITHIAAGEASVDDLEAWLTEVFGTDYLLGHLFYDQGWQPPKKCVDRWEAGKWLNTFLNEWKKEEQLVWRGE